MRVWLHRGKCDWIDGGRNDDQANLKRYINRADNALKR